MAWKMSFRNTHMERTRLRTRYLSVPGIALTHLVFVRLAEVANPAFLKVAMTMYLEIETHHPGPLAQGNADGLYFLGRLGEILGVSPSTTPDSAVRSWFESLRRYLCCLRPNGSSARGQ